MVERILTGLKERQDKQPGQSQTCWISKLAKPDGHAFVTPRRLSLIGAHKAVPPGEIKTKIAIMLLDHDGMVDTVHLRRDDQESQNPINSTGQSDIAMVEHAGPIKKHLKEDYR